MLTFFCVPRVVIFEVKGRVKTRKSQGGRGSFLSGGIFVPTGRKYFAMRWQHLTGHWGIEQGEEGGGGVYVCVCRGLSKLSCTVTAVQDDSVR
jgi:hypothetical protein